MQKDFHRFWCLLPKKKNIIKKKKIEKKYKYQVKIFKYVLNYYIKVFTHSILNIFIFIFLE
jgi:mRNA-degrading endonuclease RelE of RelBE toxin-antitoxin system